MVWQLYHIIKHMLPGPILHYSTRLFALDWSCLRMSPCVGHWPTEPLMNKQAQITLITIVWKSMSPQIYDEILTSSVMCSEVEPMESD